VTTRIVNIISKSARGAVLSPQILLRWCYVFPEALYLACDSSFPHGTAFAAQCTFTRVLRCWFQLIRRPRG